MKRITLFFVVCFVSIILLGCSKQNTVVSMVSYEVDDYQLNIYSRGVIQQIRRNVQSQ